MELNETQGEAGQKKNKKAQNVLPRPAQGLEAPGAGTRVLSPGGPERAWP
jgi:hypothetical protein